MKKNLWMVHYRIPICAALLAATFTSPLSDTLARTAGLPETSSGSSNQHPSIQILQSSIAGVTLEFTPPAPMFEVVSKNGTTCQSVSITGLEQSDPANELSLPVLGVMLGIPPDSQPAMRLLDSQLTILTVNPELCIAAPPETRSPRNLQAWFTNAENRASAASLFRTSATKPAELVSTGNLRSQRFAQLRFNPLQYDAASRELRYYSKVKVEVTFNSPAGQAASLPGGQADSLSYIDEGYFEASLQALLLNYEQARYWRNRPVTDSNSGTVSPQTIPAYKVLVHQDGIYQISYNDLAAEGLPVDTIDPRTFHLHNQDIEVAIHVEGQDNGIFESGDYLLFYGQRVNTKYTDTNVYWLTWGGTDGLRMEALEAPSGATSIPSEFFTTKRFEVDTEYFAQESNGPEKDHWYWTYVDAWYSPSFVELQLALNDISGAAPPAALRGLLNGFYTTSNHHTILSLNGKIVDDHVFPANDEYGFSIDLAQTDLQDGDNLLRIDCPLDGGGIDEVLVNWLEIDYYDTYFAEDDRLFFDGDQAGSWEFQVDGFTLDDLEAFDISNPLAPLMATQGEVEATANGYQLAFEHEISQEHHYLAQTTSERLSPLSISLDDSSNWSIDTTGAKYVIISHADFMDELQPLVAFRESQGYSVHLVDVQDLYDEFNGGVFSPEAIKAFLEYAYASWLPEPPTFVLLVGDGHFDYKDIYNYGEPNYIPPYLDDVDPWIIETATDNRYASVSGPDILPDLYIGRFPARTPAEAQTMVQKTLDYEQNPLVGDWNSKLTFVADEADSGGNFPFLSDVIINLYVPPAYTYEKIYHDPISNPTAAVRTALQAGVNEGRLLVHYAGHASTMRWATEGLLKVTDLPSLSNAEKLPFFLPMTCSEGYFIWPSQTGLSSLGESIVRIDGRGAIASWSPAGYGLSAGHDQLDRSLMNNLFNNFEYQLGYLTTQAKYDLFANTSGYNDLIETYILFGDPALELKALPPTLLQSFLPVVIR